MDNNISLLVGLKNNIDYSKHFYSTTRSLYPDVEIVFVSYGSTDGTHQWLDSLNDNNVKYYYSADTKTFSDTYNKCIEIATKPYVALLHNDVVLAPGFIENLQQSVSPQNVTKFTTVEPPVFADDERPGKIVKDFGADIADFNIEGFYSFGSAVQNEKRPDAENNATTFFFSMLRQTLVDIGGFDPLFNPMFCEDDDMIIRLGLLGLKGYVTVNALCYHFVSKTSRFSAEYQYRTQQIERNSNRNFFRKWGFSNSSPVRFKYNIGLVIKNSNNELLEKVEPLCSTVYIDNGYNGYIEKEQPNTTFILTSRIKGYHEKKENDILVYFDGTKFNGCSLGILENLATIINDKVNKGPGIIYKLLGMKRTGYKKNIFTIKIINLVTYQHQLIKRK
ncbi:GT2 family glycosyltransferase [Mucilaginibacter oryzae]|uniref:GT2 family glycosyltransferase n=2 Tax=Mucilaginibacter oryzae TaxID=468058 RepID=A0A316HHU8_9SPHI|nr:GT2 family glycosyltransferase [Mucilaginibacter oryzae]